MRQHFPGSSKLRQMPTTHLEMQINQGDGLQSWRWRWTEGYGNGPSSQVGKPKSPSCGIIIWIRFCVWLAPKNQLLISIKFHSTKVY